MAASQAPVLSNTTPLINLVGVSLLDLLPALYGTVVIPDLVRDEYNAGKSATDPDLDQLSWLTVVPAASRECWLISVKGPASRIKLPFTDTQLPKALV